MSIKNESEWEQGTNSQYLFAQFGHRNQRRITLSMILEANDFQGDGWSQYDQKCWRTGKLGLTNERRIRARRIGTYTATRSYSHSASQKAIIARIAPMASEMDAEAEVPRSGLHLIKRSGKIGSFSDEIQIEDLAMPDFPNAILTECVVTGPSGIATLRTVRGNIDRVIFLVGCGALDGGLLWQDVFSIAKLQVMKIQNTLTTSL